MEPGKGTSDEAIGPHGKGSSDEAIGRPGPWTEGRYQLPGQPVDQTVQRPPGQPDSNMPASKPVTLKDYGYPTDAVDENASTEPPGGDAG
jgi:hypothetical protein